MHEKKKKEISESVRENKGVRKEMLAAVWFREDGLKAKKS